MNTRFRICAQYIFLTYPRCELTPSSAAEALKLKIPGFQWGVWGQEKHQDGTFHLHALIHANPRFDSRNPRCLDITLAHDIRTFHGDYRGAARPASVFEYVIKDGNVFYDATTESDVRALLQGPSKKRPSIETVVEQRKQGRSLVQIQKDHPEFTTVIIRDGKKINDFYMEYMLENARPQKKLLNWTTKNFLGDAIETKVLVWLTNNILKPRSHRQKQLWIAGPTKHGKTTLVLKMMEGLRIYYVPTDEDFYDDYRDGCYDLAVIDEYKHQKTVTWLNRFVEGACMSLRRKGSQVLKTDKLPIIILSNFRIRDCYCNVDEVSYAALTDRFEEVWLTKPLDIEPVWEQEPSSSEAPPPAPPVAPVSVQPKDSHLEFPCWDEQYPHQPGGPVELDKASDCIPRPGLFSDEVLSEEESMEEISTSLNFY